MTEKQLFPSPVSVRVLSVQKRIDETLHVLFRVAAAAAPFKEGTEIEHDFDAMLWGVPPGDAELFLHAGRWILVPSDVEEQVFESSRGDLMREALIEIGAWDAED